MSAPVLFLALAVLAFYPNAALWCLAVYAALLVRRWW